MVPKETLAEHDIHVFNELYQIKNEQGLKLEFHDRAFLWDIYSDMSPLLCVLKPPQIGMTVLMLLKSFWTAKNLRKDIIYTLPTQGDVSDMAGGKINRIIAQNPIFAEWIKDHDSVEQKQVGDNMIHYRGTFTKKQAMMVSSKLNIHDEVDASDQIIIEQYETRLQAQADGWRWYFSHPSATDYGIDVFWQQSDQKHWFITCPHCKKEQYLEFPKNIDFAMKAYVCKHCNGVLSDDDRRHGRWIPKYSKQWQEESDIKKPFSGYWVSQLMCPWITAEKILRDYAEKTPEYFWNYVLGLPYQGGDSKLNQQALYDNLTGQADIPLDDERIVLGIDTGRRIDYVMGNERVGLFFHGDCPDYRELDAVMKKWKKAIAIIDAGGDQIGAQQFYERWRGRVFQCYLQGDRKGPEIATWGENEKWGTILADRDKCIQLVVDEFRTKSIPLQGNENDWHEYWLDWKNLSRIKIFDSRTNALKGTKWVRNGRDHRALATVFWRVGMTKFASSDEGAILNKSEKQGNFGYESDKGQAFIPIVRG